MKVLLAHDFKQYGDYGSVVGRIRGWIEGELIAGDERCNIVNAEGNFLVKGATPTFIKILKDKGMLVHNKGNVDGR